MPPEKHLDVRQPERLRWWNIGDGQRAFEGPADRVYGAIEVARERGEQVEVTASVPARRPGYIVVTVRLLPPLPVYDPRIAANGRRRSVRRALTYAGVGTAVGVGAVWAVVSAIRAIVEAVVANIAVFVGFSAVMIGCAVLLFRRGCEIYVTHIRH